MGVHVLDRSSGRAQLCAIVHDQARLDGHTSLIVPPCLDVQARALKRPRLVWTPRLHRVFEAAVQKLGVDKAVPKTIMQLMNVEGLTRENVASHLQKYRLQLKKQGGGTAAAVAALEGEGGSTAASGSGAAAGGAERGAAVEQGGEAPSSRDEAAGTVEAAAGEEPS